MSDPLERKYGVYRITLRKDDHVVNGRPSPHIEVWKGHRKIGNFDMASSKLLFNTQLNVPNAIRKSIEAYLKDRQVISKIESMVKESYFDLSKPAGEYGGIPRGFKATISVEYNEQSLGHYIR